MASYTGIKAILTEFLDRLQKGDIANLKSSISSIESVNTTQSNLISSLQSTVSFHTSSISSLNSRPYITASNLSETGYVKWSNGLLIQWGKSSAANNTNNYYQANVTMPLAFKSASSYQVALNGIPSGSVPGFVCALDNTAANGTTWTAQRFGMQLMYCSNPRWIAIGKA